MERSVEAVSTIGMAGRAAFACSLPAQRIGCCQDVRMDLKRGG